jgi:hypothetical protein
MPFATTQEKLHTIALTHEIFCAVYLVLLQRGQPMSSDRVSAIAGEELSQCKKGYAPTSMVNRCVPAEI